MQRFICMINLMVLSNVTLPTFAQDLMSSDHLKIRGYIDSYYTFDFSRPHLRTETLQQVLFAIMKSVDLFPFTHGRLLPFFRDGLASIRPSLREKYIYRSVGKWMAKYLRE